MSGAWDGRPENPEREAEHMMEWTDEHGRTWREVWRWWRRPLAAEWIWLRPNFQGPVYAYTADDVVRPHIGIRYLGPCLTPAEVAEQIAERAEAAFAAGLEHGAAEVAERERAAEQRGIERAAAAMRPMLRSMISRTEAYNAIRALLTEAGDG